MLLGRPGVSANAMMVYNSALSKLRFTLDKGVSFRSLSVPHERTRRDLLTRRRVSPIFLHTCGGEGGLDGVQSRGPPPGLCPLGTGTRARHRAAGVARPLRRGASACTDVPAYHRTNVVAHSKQFPRGRGVHGSILFQCVSHIRIYVSKVSLQNDQEIHQSAIKSILEIFFQCILLQIPMRRAINQVRFADQSFALHHYKRHNDPFICFHLHYFGRIPNCPGRGRRFLSILEC